MDIYWGIYIPSQIYMLDVWGYKRFAMQYILDTNHETVKFMREHTPAKNKYPQPDFQRYLNVLVLLKED